MVPLQSGSPAAAARLPIDTRRLSWIPSLAADYAFDHGRVASFFAGDPTSGDAWKAAITRAQRRGAHGIADVVDAQLRRRDAPPESLRSAAELRAPGAVAVVTGQQAGLFGGPLFTLLKALTAIQLAERVRQEFRVPATPVFWIDAEDHDWNEVQSCGLLDADLNLCRAAMGDPPGAGQLPVARVTLDDSVSDALKALESILTPTEFTPALLESLRAIYRPGAGMSDAFARWLEHVLGPKGLVVFDASDPAAKPLAAGIFRREIEHAGDTARLAGSMGTALESAGYRAQVTPAEGAVALFHLDGGRLPIRREGDTFRWGDHAVERPALLDHVSRTPEAFSPNVLLRPLVQDTLFPTACYVAGPNELGYLAQLGPIYEAFGVPRPLIHQRAAATVLDANATRFLSKYDVALESLRPQDDSVLNRLLTAQLPASVEAEMDGAVRAVDEHMGRLAAAMPQIDATLEGAARSTLGRMQDDLKKLHGKIIQAAKRKDETLRRQFLHARAQAFPGGEPQERQLGFVYFLNRYGPGFVDRLAEAVPTDAGMHWLVTI